MAWLTGALLLVTPLLAAHPSLAGRPASNSPAQNVLDAAADAMYNAEYQDAERMIRAYLSQHPADPRAWNYLAEAVLDREMLKENLYSGAAYSRRGTAFHRREVPLTQSFTANLNDALNHAQTLEERRLGQNPRDEQALYWLGVTYSTRAEFAFTLERSYLTALREGKKAWEENERLNKLDPGFADTGLVIGLAEYTAGVLPWYVKIVASLEGIHGSRSQGIEELKRAASQGRYTRVDAKIVLVAIYERERQFARALDLLQSLEAQYPLNYLADLEIGRVDEVSGDWRAAAAAYDRAVAEFVRRDPSRPDVPRARILFRDAQAHEHLGNLETALALYREAASFVPRQLDGYRAELAAAQLDQRLNHFSAARREYQLVADAAPEPELVKEAKGALRNLR